MSGNFSSNQMYLLMGSSSGMGRSIAHELVRRGASVLLASRREEPLRNVQLECQSLRQSESQVVDYTTIDFLDGESPSRLSWKLNGRSLAGVLVNGGGPHGENPLAIKPEELTAAHSLLFQGPLLHLQAALPHLADGSAIVGITSTTVKEPHASLTLSGCYRSALTSHLKNLSDILGSRRISVNSVAPGYIETARLADLRHHEAARLGQDTEEINRSWSTRASLGRLGRVEEVANLVCFLFSDQCRFLTGQIIVADGGQIRCIH